MVYGSFMILTSLKKSGFDDRAEDTLAQAEKKVGALFPDFKKQAFKKLYSF